MLLGGVGSSKVPKAQTMTVTFNEIRRDLDELRRFIIDDMTKTVRWKGHVLEIGISWRSKSHLSFDDAHTKLFVNVRDLASDLRKAFDRYKRELQQDPELPDRFVKSRKKGRTVEVKDEGRVVAWRRLVGH